MASKHRYSGHCKSISHFIAFILIAALLISGCVSDKKYEDQQTPVPTQTMQGQAINTDNGPVISSDTGDMMELYDLEKLDSMSDCIVIGKVVEIMHSRWNTLDGRKPVDSEVDSYIIFTDVVINVDSYLKNPLYSKNITVRVLGGTVEGVSILLEDQPSFRSGERVLVFLKNDDDPRTRNIKPQHFTTAGLFQGKITIIDEEVIIGDEKLTLDEIQNRIT